MIPLNETSVTITTELCKTTKRLRLSVALQDKKEQDLCLKEIEEYLRRLTK